MFSFPFGVSHADCAWIRSLKLQRLKSQTQRDIIYKSKFSATPPLKRLIQTRPTCLRHSVGRFANHSRNVHAEKGGMIFILAVVLLLPAPCPGDAVFRCERESTLFGLPKEDTTKISG